MTTHTTPISIDPKLAQIMYTRVLRSWASDVLNLRRQGLDKPSFRTGTWTAGTDSVSGPWPFAESARRRSRAA